LFRPSASPDLPVPTANTIKVNICLYVLQLFSFPQTEDIQSKKKEYASVFPTEREPPPISAATPDRS
jgi:hypothetical protein